MKEKIIKIFYLYASLDETDIDSCMAYINERDFGFIANKIIELFESECEQ